MSALIPRAWKVDYWLIIIPLSTITVRLIIFLFIPNTYEDAFITFRYAENLAAGHGLVYNLGERVLGTTTPLFALVLAFFNVLGITCIHSSLGINLLAEATTSYVVYALLRSFSQSKIAAIPALLFVFSPSNISWAISGMETSFYSSIIAISLYFLIKGKYFPAVLFGFLSAVVRIDGLSVAAVVTLFVLFLERPLKFRTLALPILVFACWELLLYSYFGAFIPSTLRAKLVLYSGHQVSRTAALADIISKFMMKDHFLSSIMTLAFLGGCFIVFLRGLNYQPLFVWFFIYYGALAFSNTMIHGWYLIPPLFAFIIISSLSFLFVYDIFLARVKISATLVTTGFVFSVLAFSTLTLHSKIMQLDQENHIKDWRVSLGKFIDTNAPPNATLYLEPIGTIGYYAKRYIYDDAGLISPQFIELNRLDQTMENISKKVEVANPDFLVLRIIDLDKFYRVPTLVSKYKEIKRSDFLRGGEQLGMSVFKKT